MRIILKSLHLSQFKGVADKTYDFSSIITRIKAMNGRGKTTIATAFMWLLFDKDYALASNPNVRQIGAEEALPTVTAALDIDGKEVILTKSQKCKKSKPDENGISKVSLTNSYEVNAVPKAERDFKAYLEDLGVDFSNALACMHPSVFTSQKAADMRKILFKMASEKSDYDIASMSQETADVARLLSDYTMEEITAMNKASKKKADEQVKSIPDQIVGLEKAKIEIDVAELELQKKALTEKIADCDLKIKDSGKIVSDLEQEKLKLSFEINDYRRNANETLVKQHRELDDLRFDYNSKFNEMHQKVHINECAIQEKKKLVEQLDAERKELGVKYSERQADVFNEAPYVFDELKWVFDENSTVCSLCGQTLPDDKIEALKSEFESKKETAKKACERRMEEDKKMFDSYKRNDLERIKTQGFEKKNQIDKLNTEIAEIEYYLPDMKAQELELQDKRNEADKQLNGLPAEVDLSEDAGYTELLSKDKDLTDKIAAARSNGADTSEIEMERATFDAELEVVKSKIAQSENNVRIDSQIEDLQKQQRDYEQAKADAERILYQLSLVSKKKNELLVEDINSKFSMVKWVLFDYQKNGEYKEVCVPTIDGFRFGESTNTGREIIAKLDICNSLQKFFGTSYPVWLDNAESLNDCNLPAMDCQMVLLTVSEDAELKVEV